MEKPFSTVRYMSICEISKQDINIIVDYKKDLERICKWAGNRRDLDITSTLHFNIELKRTKKFLSEFKPLKYEEIKDIKKVTIGDIPIWNNTY